MHIYDGDVCAMDIFYINVADQIHRREFVERNFAAIQRPGWRLSRIDAVTVETARNMPGRIRDGEKACFQSHLCAIEKAQHAAGHVLIAEDDILFGEGSLPAIERALASIAEDDWDILFTDLVIPNAGPMANLYLLRQRLARSGGSQLLDLSNLNFAGTTAYIVNHRVRDKVLQALAADASLDVPYDLQLRKLIHSKTLRGHVIIPFPTTVSAFADTSQIQDTNLADAVWTAFRRLIWLERDIGAAMKPLAIEKAEPGAEAFALLLTAMQSADYKKK